MKLLVVIVNYRVTHLTIDCLRSVATEIDSVPGTHVAVCENGTGDNSAARIQTAIDENGWQSWCTVTAITPNLGFTGGNNVILRKALASETHPEYVLLLNSDTLVRNGSFKALVDFMDAHPEVGIAGSRLEDPDGAPQRSAFRFQTPLSEFERSIRLRFVTRLLESRVVAPPPPVEACRTDWVSGASMIVRREVLDAVGLLDEGYFTYFDDIDFCFNAARAGWETWYVPDSRVVHLVGQTTGVSSKRPKRDPQYMLQARRRFFLKNYGPLRAALADMGLIFGSMMWRTRVALGKADTSPPFALRDAVANSVFVAGFRLKDVPNPALETVKRRELGCEANDTTGRM